MQLNSVSRLLTGLESPKKISLPRLNNNNQISLLASPDKLFINSRSSNNIFSNNVFSDSQLSSIMQKSLQSADFEWRSGVRENNGNSNRSPRIDQYYRNSSFSPGKGGWCGFFVAYNYSQQGFKYPEKLAGMEKGRDFFLYRQYTDHSNSKNSELDSLRMQHQGQGSQRQFFMLSESPSLKYIEARKDKLYQHINLNDITFNYYNLPIQAGDTVLFDTGVSGGHVGMVASYDQKSGKLITIEGNTSGKMFDGKNRNGVVAYKEYDLTNPSVRKKIAGFGRPALSDFQ